MPKTDAGRRTLYVDGVLLAALRKWRVTCSMNAVRMGGAYQCTYETAAGLLHTEPRAETPPEDWTFRALVCVDRFGLPICYGAVQTALKGFGLNAHSFRHTHATRLIEAGGLNPLTLPPVWDTATRPLHRISIRMIPMR